MYIKTLTVSGLNNYLKKIVDSDIILNNISIKGEISNFKNHSSGHLYFTLKDEFSKINCVMFKDRARSVKFDIENGLNVEIKGRVSIYTKEGTYQIYCDDMQKQGVGDLFLAFERLKEQLKEEGIFDEFHKKALPLYPKRVGIITSPTGAALRDIINIWKRRNNKIDIVIYPALVQGKESSKSLINGVKELNKRKDIDVIIMARGGGSIEELWSFNDKDLAYAIYDSKIPVVTGVGHETDFTIVDFVSDIRMPTPSAAAEIVFPVYSEKVYEIDDMRKSLHFNLNMKIKDLRKEVEILERELKINNPKSMIANEYNMVATLKERLKVFMDKKIDKEKHTLYNYNELLKAHNPLNILNKGYAIIENKDEKIITSKDELIEEKREIKIKFKDGIAEGFFESLK